MSEKITKHAIEKISAEVWDSYGLAHCVKLLKDYADENGKIDSNDLAVVSIMASVDVSNEILFRVLNSVG